MSVSSRCTERTNSLLYNLYQTSCKDRFSGHYRIPYRSSSTRACIQIFSYKPNKKFYLCSLTAERVATVLTAILSHTLPRFATLFYRCHRCRRTDGTWTHLCRISAADALAKKRRKKANFLAFPPTVRLWKVQKHNQLTSCTFNSVFNYNICFISE